MVTRHLEIPETAKLIGYARVSTRQQSTGRQEADLLAAAVCRDGLYNDHGVSGTRASRPKSIVRSGRPKRATFPSSPRWIGWAARHKTCSPTQTDCVLPVHDYVCQTSEAATSTRPHRWIQCCSPSWQPSRRWNTRSSESVLLTRSANDASTARISAGGDSGPQTARFATRSASWRVAV